MNTPNGKLSAAKSVLCRFIVFNLADICDKKQLARQCGEVLAR
jgi:hypothetical protein